MKPPRHRGWERAAGVYDRVTVSGRGGWQAVVSVAPTGPASLWLINSAAVHSSFCCAGHGSGSGGSAGANLSPCLPGALILVGPQRGAREISLRSSSHSWSVLRRSSKAGMGVRIDWGRTPRQLPKGGGARSKFFAGRLTQHPDSKEGGGPSGPAPDSLLPGVEQAGWTNTLLSIPQRPPPRRSMWAPTFSSAWGPSPCSWASWAALAR